MFTEDIDNEKKFLQSRHRKMLTRLLGASQSPSGRCIKLDLRSVAGRSHVNFASDAVPLGYSTAHDTSISRQATLPTLFSPHAWGAVAMRKCFC
jgi:hypothetical protein